MSSGTTKNVLLLSVFLIIGMAIGTFLGKIISPALPLGTLQDILTDQIPIGLQPTTINLQVIEFTVGLIFNFNLLSIVGIIIALILYRAIIK